MKQTAVEYLVEQLFPKALSTEQYYHIEKAKEMEKQQKQNSDKKYSEEEVLELLIKCPFLVPSNVKEWFEQFKNK